MGLNPAPRPPAPILATSRRPRCRGVTLIELLTVLAILGLLFSFGVGVYRTVANVHALPAAVSQVSSVVRAARNYSVSAGLPSKVFVDPEAGRISAFGYELVAAWHFEDAPGLAEGEGDAPIAEGTRLFGARREFGEVFGSVFAVRGKIGSGLWFQDNGAAVVADHSPRLRGTHGFSVEAWVLFGPPVLSPEVLAKAIRKDGAWKDPRREDFYAVISKHGSYELGLLGDGAVYVAIGDLDGEEEPMLVTTRGKEVLEGRWAHVRASFDGVDLTVEVDGMEREWFPAGFELIDPRDWPPLPLQVPDSDGDLTVSHPGRFFMGGIDEPKIRVALEPRSYTLPSGLFFVGNPVTIHFDSRGSLDPILHPRPVILGVIDFDPRVETTGNTGVVTGEAQPPPQANPSDLLDADLGEDPLQALIRFVEQSSERSLGSDGEVVEKMDPLQEAEERAQRGEGRLQRVIVDLTGTIRGA